MQRSARFVCLAGLVAAALFACPAGALAATTFQGTVKDAIGTVRASGTIIFPILEITSRR